MREVFICDAVSSHVTLAACKPSESAYETRDSNGIPHGAFTNALITALCQVPLDRMTYQNLIDCLPRLSHQQTPQCGGRNKNGILFNAHIPSVENYNASFPVKQTNDNYEVGAGLIHGVCPGTECPDGDNEVA